MKKTLYLLLLLVVPTFASAAFNDVTLTTSTIINTGGFNLTVSGSSAVLESITVGASNFSVVLQSGSSISIASADRKVFDVSPGNGAFTSSASCSGSQSTFSLSATGAETVTITPTATTCALPSASGGSASPYSPTPIPGNPAIRINNGAATTSTQNVTLSITASNAAEMLLSNDANFSAAVWELYAATKNWRLSGALGTTTVYVKFRNLNNVVSGPSSQSIVFLAPVVSTPPSLLPTSPTPLPTTISLPPVVTPPGSSLSRTVVFFRNLTTGSTGDDVAALQAFLESKGFLVMPPGVVKGYFGRVTKEALIKYQVSVGIIGTGYFGSQTRAKINTEETALPPAPAAQTIVVGTFFRNLTTGSTGDDVAALQAFLESKGFLVMPPGVVKGYFGRVTKEALIKYQVSVGIIGTGYFGPKTQATFFTL